MRGALMFIVAGSWLTAVLLTSCNHESGSGKSKTALSNATGPMCEPRVASPRRVGTASNSDPSSQASSDWMPKINDGKPAKGPRAAAEIAWIPERFRWEGPPLAPGKHTVAFDFTYDGPGFGKGGTGVLRVDGQEVANKKIPHTVPTLLTVDETFDVGVDTRTPVDDNDYQVPFRFTGKLNKLTVTLGPPQLTEAAR